MPSSVLLEQPTPMALVCHDAGAANHILAWARDAVKTRPGAATQWRTLVQGPAAKLWDQLDVPQVHLCQSTSEVLDGVQVLIAGTGWASSLEYDSIQMARKLGIRTISVIDHWVNYRARFLRNGIEVLPDEIWVTDEYAKKLVEREFSGITCCQMPNAYMNESLKQIRKHERPRGARTHLLYLLEPIRDAWGAGSMSGEFEALDYFIQHLDVLGLGETSIRLRLHPSDASDKYDQWISEQHELNITHDRCLSLAESIAWSDVVVGCQTYGMVVALAAGKKVFSSVPEWAPACVLPQDGILKLSELAQ